ncbi:MAG TPA: ATP-binding protein [Bacteroidota bacterium]
MSVKLYWKLLLGFGIIITLLTAADAYILYQLIGVSVATRATIIGDVRSMDVTKRLRSSLYDEERDAQKFTATDDTTYFALFREQQRVTRSMLDTLARVNSDESFRQLVQGAARRLAWYESAVTAHRQTPAAARRGLRDVMTDTLDAVYRDVEQLVQAKQRLLDAAVVEAEASAQRSSEVAVLLTLGAVLSAVTIALLITRSITKPLGALMRATDEVARGTFTQIGMAIHGDMGKLAAAFNSMGDRLRRANAARAEMMHHISHEIRMPLQTMHAAYYLLSEQQAGPLGERQQKLLETMRDNIDKITRFSNQFLDLAKIEAGMMEYEIGPTDLDAVLTPLVADATVNAARKQIVVSYGSTPLPRALANADRCSQVFTNLLSNAVKYTNAGGTVQVQACPSDYGVRVSVSDTGVGIAPEELPQLFKKFYRAKSAGRRAGTGIGLALVKALVDGMGGQIAVESEPGKGSTFIVEFRTAP